MSDRVPPIRSIWCSSAAEQAEEIADLAQLVAFAKSGYDRGWTGRKITPAMPPKPKWPSLAIERRTDAPTTPSPFPLSTTIAPHAIALPPEATELAAAEQNLARHFLTAWRRTHEFLLEAARWMAEAREKVEHGRWGLWLRGDRGWPYHRRRSCRQIMATHPPNAISL